MYNAAHAATAVRCWFLGICTTLHALSIREASVLDVGAGTGIGAQVLRAHLRGKVVCTEPSEAMRARIPAFLGRPFDVPAQQISRIGERFQVIAAGFDTINYLDLEELRAFFRESRSSLAPGGVVAFDFLDVDLFPREVLPILSSHCCQGHLRMVTSRVSHRRLETSVTWTPREHPGGWIENHHQYLYSTPDIVRIALSEGLLPIRSTAFLEGKPESAIYKRVVALGVRDV